jgi:hypothetical protein
MDDEKLEASLQADRRSLMITWFAFLAEPLIYALLPWILSAEQMGGVERGVAPYWKWGAFLLAVVLALASLALHRFLLSDRQIEVRLALERVGATASPPGVKSSLSEAQLVNLSRHYQTSMLICWGLNSSIPIGGLILLFTNGDDQTILVLSVLAVVLNLLAYPQLDAFVDRVRNLMVEEWM